MEDKNEGFCRRILLKDIVLTLYICAFELFKINYYIESLTIFFEIEVTVCRIFHVRRQTEVTKDKVRNSKESFILKRFQLSAALIIKIQRFTDNTCTCTFVHVHELYMEREREREMRKSKIFKIRRKAYPPGGTSVLSQPSRLS